MAFGIFITIRGGVLTRYLIGTLTTSFLGKETGTDLFYCYNSVIIYPASVCLFMAFREIRINNEKLTKVINSFGSVCIGAYLATDHSVTSQPMWRLINLPATISKGIIHTFFALFLATVLLFLFGCMMEFLRKKCMTYLHFSDAMKSFDNYCNRNR